MVDDEEVLHSYLTRYNHQDYVFREVINLMQRYKRLKCNLGDIGYQEDLLNLKGTIPIKYQGSSYNIPVRIWLLKNYPMVAPLCYVNPTEPMRIEVSKYVDYNGTVLLQYLREWSTGFQPIYSKLEEKDERVGSNLYDLIVRMQAAFSAIPPVYITPRNLDLVGYPGSITPTPSSTGSSTPSTSAATASISDIHITTPCSSVSPAPSTNTTKGSIYEEYIKASFLSAIEQKLRRCLKDRSRLKRVQQELRDGQSTLEDILSKLQTEITDFDKSVNSLEEKEKELQMAVDQLVDLL